MPPVSTVRIDGQQLRDLRTRRGLSVQKLAKKIGRARQSVTRLESGGTASLVFACQLAYALKAELAEFTLTDSTADESEQDAPETAQQAA